MQCDKGSVKERNTKGPNVDALAQMHFVNTQGAKIEVVMWALKSAALARCNTLRTDWCE